MDLVADVGEATPDDLIRAGADDHLAALLRHLSDTYFGPTAFSAKQRAAVAAAHQSGHSLGVLEIIENAARRVKHQRDKWLIRGRLCAMRGTATELARAGKKLVMEIKGPPAPPPPGVTIRRRNDDVYTMSITGRSADITPLFDAVKADADPLASVKSIFAGNGGATTVLKTMVVIPLDKATQIIDGDGEEVVLECTNGARITGAELGRTLLAEAFGGGAVDDEGYVTLLHPVKGPVNTYHARFASFKQRLMAWAEHPRCAAEGCTKPAEESQIHHLIAHAQGGHTTPENLCTLCGYHNGANDDNPNAPPRFGRMARVNGTIQRVWT